MKKCLLILLGIALTMIMPLRTFSQDPPAYAITNVTIHHADGSTVSSGKIVWRNGVIESAGADVTVPYDAYEIDGGDSLHVYPGFIDGLGHFGAPDLPSSHERAEDPGNPGYERAGIQPERSSKNHLDFESSDFESAAKQGITTASIGLRGYMLPGKADLFFLNGKKTKDHLYKESTGLQFQFRGAPGGWTNRAYPSTTMGVMARFRQLMYDAEALHDHIHYYASSEGGMPAPTRDEVIESLFDLKKNRIPMFAILDAPEDLERLTILQDEFGFDIVIVSGLGTSYRTDLLIDRNIPVLASFQMPVKPNWMQDEGSEPSSPEEERFRERQKKAYEDATQNIRRLLDAGVQTGFASAGLSIGNLHERIRGLVEEGGLTESEVLSLLTVNTAEILGIDKKVGKLEEGFKASFSVFTSPLFEEGTEVKKVISNGVIHEF